MNINACRSRHNFHPCLRGWILKQISEMIRLGELNFFALHAAGFTSEQRNWFVAYGINQVNWLVACVSAATGSSKWVSTLFCRVAAITALS